MRSSRWQVDGPASVSKGTSWIWPYRLPRKPMRKALESIPQDLVPVLNTAWNAERMAKNKPGQRNAYAMVLHHGDFSEQKAENLDRSYQYGLLKSTE